MMTKNELERELAYIEAGIQEAAKMMNACNFGQRYLEGAQREIIMQECLRASGVVAMLDAAGSKVKEMIACL